MENLETILTIVVIIDSIIFSLIAIWLVASGLSSRDYFRGERILSSLKTLSPKLYRAFEILFWFVIVTGVICGVWLSLISDSL